MLYLQARGRQAFQYLNCFNGRPLALFFASWLQAAWFPFFFFSKKKGDAFLFRSAIVFILKRFCKLQKEKFLNLNYRNYLFNRLNFQGNFF